MPTPWNTIYDASNDDALQKEAEHDLLYKPLVDSNGLLQASDTKPITRRKLSTSSYAVNDLPDIVGIGEPITRGTADYSRQGEEVKKAAWSTMFPQEDLDPDNVEVDLPDVLTPDVVSNFGLVIGGYGLGRLQGANKTSPFTSKSLRESVPSGQVINLADATTTDIVPNVLEQARSAIVGASRRTPSSAISAVIGTDAESYVNLARQKVETSQRLYAGGNVGDLFPGHGVYLDDNIDKGIAQVTTIDALPAVDANKILGVVGPFKRNLHIGIYKSLRVEASIYAAGADKDENGFVVDTWLAWERDLVGVRYILEFAIQLKDPEDFYLIKNAEAYVP